MKILARMMIVPAIGVVLLASNGCGSNSVKLEPDGGQKIQQARINAYGPSGTAPTIATPGSSSSSSAPLSGQAAARQRAQQGGR